MSLELWLGNGWVKEHKPTPREIAELLAVADRALKDCQIALETAENIRSSMELMDQTDEGETLVKEMLRMIEGKRLKVKVYTKGLGPGARDWRLEAANCLPSVDW